MPRRTIYFSGAATESIEIKITDDRISSVPSQSGNVNVIPSNSKESSALLNGSAQLKMLAFGPPINCAPFRYRLNVRDVTNDHQIKKRQNQTAVNDKVCSLSGIKRQQNQTANQHTPADDW
ncbi:Uncharacterised protein [Escherichia coli]|uniref:Uncharacterized protein n=1 Tax=Escherichia coli TaxID=562 RepID=A0A377AIK3_ECOLX|nr:Uncharacterised protein [Escherichia coli]